jgi:hypothetical protein
MSQFAAHCGRRGDLERQLGSTSLDLGFQKSAEGDLEAVCGTRSRRSIAAVDSPGSARRLGHATTPFCVRRIM